MTKKSRKQEIADLKIEIKELETELPAVKKEAKEKAKEYQQELFDNFIEIAEEISSQDQAS